MKYFLLLAISVASWGTPAIADDSKPPKELVEELSQKAHEAFITVKNAEGQHVVKPEDAKKLKYPLVNYEEREMAVARGYLSGYANWCGLEWGKNFFAPYMKALKLEHEKKWTPYQYAYVEILHGLSMGVATHDKKGETCPAAEKKRLTALSKK